ncbi:MAG TPA: hypothetical protein VF026_16240 [Ktedonobacteraceae bacterium]
MSINQRDEPYCAECAKTDAGAHGAIQHEHTERVQELDDAWQAAIRDCTTWRDGNTTWHVLNKYQVGDLEMWHCRIVEPGFPDEIADCDASFVYTNAQPVDDESAR